MKTDGYWALFRLTGAPLCYLLSRAQREAGENAQKRGQEGGAEAALLTEEIHMFLTTRGLVLREAKYKESDKILTILTAEEGKLTVKARGVARTRSKISAATQLYGYASSPSSANRGMWT